MFLVPSNDQSCLAFWRTTSLLFAISCFKLLPTKLARPRFTVSRTRDVDCFERRMHTKIGGIVTLETKISLSVSGPATGKNEFNQDSVWYAVLSRHR